jgi:hypothetical protein
MSQPSTKYQVNLAISCTAATSSNQVIGDAIEVDIRNSPDAIVTHIETRSDREDENRA